ncbi:RNA 2',3'-cyclic phosphodiesterase [Actinomadura atramentaria]|uniref:RNA 2',3'-cyclic phosphodiesterase n=1 Tax=Actinomadura atramentaria TaxID=1990 RepID=UPI000360A585|nr:RNA 2',3'-cyclic phosphodiesterase [Actinomadura atramentaria]
MRLFAALVPPPGVLDAVERFTGPLRGAWPGLRWVRRDMLHVTVAFFGELDAAGLDLLTPRLELLAARHARMRLTLAGGGAFPAGGQHARVLWTGLYGDRRALAGLAAAAASAGAHAGAAAEGHRTFRPHLTLARTRCPADVRPLLEPLATFAAGPWTAAGLQLVRSRPPDRDRPHPTYETLATYPLADPTP